MRRRRQMRLHCSGSPPLFTGWNLGRAGTTLSEVLISLLVMSIGVVSLATLFPISILRSVQATQLTNATNLRYNVEAMLSIRPELYSIGAPWQAGYNQYNVGDIVIPTELTRIMSPAVAFQCITPGVSDTTEPNWNFTDQATTSESTVQWQTYRLQNYVIDPLGAWNVESTYRTTGGFTFFGHWNDGTTITPRALNGYGTTGIRAFGGIGVSNATDALAAEAATLPDSWVTQADALGITYTPGGTTCTLTDLNTDLTNTTPFDSTGIYPLSRIVFYDASGKYSDVRTISGIVGSGTSQAVSWTAGALTIVPARARVETKERRFSWLLSVNRSISGASVVVFFRRPFSGKDEQVYPATFNAITDPGFDGQPGIAGYNDDDPNGLDSTNLTDDPKELGYLGSDDQPRNWVVIQYNAALGKPFLKKGGFITDADNLRWYRVLDIVENDLISLATYTNPVEAVMRKAGINTALSYYTPETLATGMTDAIFVKVEDKILQTGPQPSSGVPTGGAMVMRGIVDVFPIHAHQSWED
jgi:Tfp pilus assembly protein PilV